MPFFFCPFFLFVNDGKNLRVLNDVTGLFLPAAGWCYLLLFVCVTSFSKNPAGIDSVERGTYTSANTLTAVKAQTIFVFLLYSCLFFYFLKTFPTSKVLFVFFFKSSSISPLSVPFSTGNCRCDNLKLEIKERKKGEVQKKVENGESVVDERQNRSQGASPIYSRKRNIRGTHL